MICDRNDSLFPQRIWTYSGPLLIGESLGRCGLTRSVFTLSALGRFEDPYAATTPELAHEKVDSTRPDKSDRMNARYGDSHTDTPHPNPNSGRIGIT